MKAFISFLWLLILLLSPGCDTAILVDNRQVPVIKLADDDLLNLVKTSPTPFPPIPPDTYTIETVAGQDEAGFGGDGGPAQQASMSYPAGLAFDKAGNLYIADRNNNRIRKMDLQGNMGTVAGGGLEIKDGLATEVRLVRPVSVAVDSVDQVYILEEIGQKVYRLGRDGLLKKIAGAISKIDLTALEILPQPALQAIFKEPLSLAIDAQNNIFVSDSLHSMIRKIDNTGTIQTVAGRGNASAQFSGDGTSALGAEMAYPAGIAISAQGEVAIADRFNHRVRKISSTGVIQTVAGNRNLGYNGDDIPATDSSLLEPYAVAFEKGGSLLIGEMGTQLVRKVDHKTGLIKTIAGCPGGICLEQITADLVLKKRGSLLKQSIAVKLSAPKGIAISPQGHIYFSEGNRIRKLVLIQASKEELARLQP